MEKIITTRSDENIVFNEQKGIDEQKSVGLDLHTLLKQAAIDAEVIIGSGAIAIGNRMAAFMTSKLSNMLDTPSFDFFIELNEGLNGDGCVGWANNGLIFGGCIYWSGTKGVLPGIGSKYGVTCTLVWF